MEIKKTPKADLENKKSTWMLIGYVIVLAFMFIAFGRSAISRLIQARRLLISILKKKWFLSLNRKKK